MENELGDPQPTHLKGSALPAVLVDSVCRLRSLITNMPIVLFALDRAGILTLWEGKGIAALGLKPSEAIGRSVFELYRDEPQILENFRRVLGGEAFNCTVEVSELSFEVWYSPLRDETGGIAGAIGVAADVTKRRLAERTLQRRVKLETLIASISTRFINLGTNNIDDGINQALMVIGEFAGVDRSYVFQLSEDRKTGSNTHEWCAEGIDPQIGNLQDLPVDAFPGG